MPSLTGPDTTEYQQGALRGEHQQAPAAADLHRHGGGCWFCAGPPSLENLNRKSSWSLQEPELTFRILNTTLPMILCVDTFNRLLQNLFQTSAGIRLTCRQPGRAGRTGTCPPEPRPPSTAGSWPCCQGSAHFHTQPVTSAAEQPPIRSQPQGRRPSREQPSASDIT